MSTDASGIEDNERFDLRRAFDITASFAEDNDGDSGSDEGDNASGSEDDNEQESSGGSSSEGGSESESSSEVKDPAKKRLSDENAKYRTAAKAEKERADDLAARLKAIEDKDKSELERAQADLKALQEGVASKDESLVSLRLKVALYEQESLQEFADPQAAIALMDRDVILDKDGNVDPEGVNSECEKIKARNALVLKPKEDGEEESASGAKSGSANNGKKKTGVLDQAALVKKFPALQGR